MVVSSSTDKKFVSQNYFQRAGLVPTMVALGLGWLFAAVAFVCGMSLLSTNLSAAIVLLVATGLISIYMYVLSRRLNMQSSIRYELLITPSEVVLYTYDTAHKRQFAQSLAISQIRNAEYFSALDVASLSLRGNGHELNIPLWAFGAKTTAKILEAISRRGINYMDVTHTSSPTRF